MGGMGAWCTECGDGRIFYENLFSKIFFHHMIEMVYLFTLELKHGQGELLFVLLSVFGQHIFVGAGA